jgi:hypothetical protein
VCLAIAERAGVATGASGQPVMDEVYAEAERRGIEIVAVPFTEACDLLMRDGGRATAAIFHVTC